MRPSAGTALLWILAGVSSLLLVYEAWTLIGSVLRPLLANPNALQTDFHYYYDAAQRMAGDRSRLYLPTDDVIAGFAYPPPAIVPFLWLARWPLGTALIALTVLSYLMIAVAAQQWVKHLRAQGWAIDRSALIALLPIVFAIGPVYMNAIFGQVNAFVLASAVAFVRLAPIAAGEAGLVLALGAWLKIYPALLAAVGLWDRSTWRAIGYAILAGVVIAIALLPIVPASAYSAFLFDVLPARGDKTAIHVVNQSLVAFVERFRFPAAEFLNWTGHESITVSAAVRAFNWLGAAAVIALLAKSAAPREIKAAVVMAMIAVIAPLGWGHTYVMALPLVMMRLLAIKHSPPATAAIVFGCVAAMLVPAGRRLPIDAAPDWIENILYSRYLLATMVLMLISSMTATDRHGAAPGISSA
jgi:hypothetical protein